MQTQYEGIKSLENLEFAKRYNRWIIDQFREVLQEPVLEVGSGTGNISTLLPKSKLITFSDIDAGLVSYLKEKFKNKKNISVIQCDISKTPPKSYENYFSSIIAINVLEHIENDQKAIKNLNMLLKKNGKVGILVPAKKKAYTNLDKKLGHFRRYESKELQEKFVKGGFIIERMYPFNFVGLVGWFLFHKISGKSEELGSSKIQLFEYLVPVLKVIEKILPPPTGISLIVIARKS